MTHLTRACFTLLILGLAWLPIPHASAAVITNGDFSIPETNPLLPGPFEGWSTDISSGLVAPADGGGFALFHITDFVDPLVHLEQTFQLPGNATTLSFEFQLSSVSGGSSFIFASSDSFQASLFDSVGNPVSPVLPGFLDAFYLFDASGFQDLGSGVSVEHLAGDLKRVSLDVSSLAAQNYTLEFLLLGDDDELQTTVALDNVVVAQQAQVIPEPASIAMWSLLSVVALPLSRRGRQKARTGA